MRVITARNVNEAFVLGLALLREDGRPQASRVSDVLVTPYPVTTTYRFPMERVLFDPVRDANPFFHLFEALWMLAGRNDATWLDQFVHDFSERFAEPDGHMHGAYGFRWRAHFEEEGGGHPADQLETVVQMLRKNPDDRRVVIQMWDVLADLGANKKDVPCNLSALPRVIDGRLDLTVFCRSNDIVWGAYGANAVHFSVLQEYLAARIGVRVGAYHQISNNYHIYRSMVDKLDLVTRVSDPYGTSVRVTPLVVDAEAFDGDLERFFAVDYDRDFRNPFFPNVAIPLLLAHRKWKEGDRPRARGMVSSLDSRSDWVRAVDQWMGRRK